MIHILSYYEDNKNSKTDMEVTGKSQLLIQALARSFDLHDLG